MDRRDMLRAAFAGLLGSQLPLELFAALADEAPAPPPGNFTFDTVIARARDASTRPFVRPEMKLTEPFADLNYDQFRGIRFREDKRLFTDDGPSFRLEMMPPGFNYGDRVELNVVRNGNVEPVAFSTEYFSFQPEYFPYPDGRAPSDLGKDLGFSGIRLRYPLNRPGVWDEVAVFQGASYFRAVARDTLYGLSARGLAINTTEPAGEEFPLFTAFWIWAPNPGDRTLHLQALLDSTSISGAYDLAITPGSATVMEIRSVLFPRVAISKVGIAPLTSMYFFGPESRIDIDDLRDAVHDSDGLTILDSAGERLWRPLRNPKEVQVSAFSDQNPRRFGLLQRNRDYTHFNDAEARYERRVSAWVEPIGDWGAGAVLLFELPTDSDLHDNIVAFWRPDAPLPAGSEQDFSYRLIWGPGPAEDRPIAKVVGTRSGLDIIDHKQRVFAVDFDLGLIDITTVTPQLSISAGEISGLSISPLPGGNIARVSFHFVPGDLKLAEFRLALASEGDTAASEVWLYRWTAK